MKYSIGTWIMWAGMTAWIVWALVLSWPTRRWRQFTLRLTVAALPEPIWKAYCSHCEDPGSAPLRAGIKSIRQICESPPTFEYLIDMSGGYGSHHTTAHYEILETRDNEYERVRITEFDGRPFPFGPRHSEEFVLEPRSDGTAVTLAWQGETVSLDQYRRLRRAYGHFLRRLQAFCERGEVLPVVPRRSVRSNLLLSLLALGTFALWLGWLNALMLAGVLVLHEFGHLVAMRMTGQPAPRLMLVPFFGGVALANHPHKTLFHDAFCALMGAGLSALASLAFIVAVQASGGPTLVPWLLKLGFMVGALNLLQLVPLLPLDGGQVLRAVMQSLHAAWARRVLLGLGGLGVVGLALAGDPLLAGVAAVGGVHAWHMSNEPPRARPMGGLGMAVIGGGFAAAAFVHAAAAYVAVAGLGYFS
jgi:Zn-dependent protease